MKILFLDVDGVLNSRESFLANHAARTAYKGKDGELATQFIWPLGHLSEDLIDNLNLIVEATGCSIVLSSSWRITCELPDFRGWLKQKGFLYPNNIISKTDNIPDDARGGQIQRWLDSHPGVTKYAILDDDSEDIIGSYTTKKHPNNFVKTDFKEGLQGEQVAKAIAILGIGK